MQATLSAGGAHSGPWVHRDEPGGVVAACVPLMDRGQPVGLLVLEHDTRHAFEAAPGPGLARAYGGTVVSLFAP